MDDLHGVIEQIGTIYQKYVYLLKATEFVLTPFVQYDWKAVFRVPWIRAPS